MSNPGNFQNAERLRDRWDTHRTIDWAPLTFGELSIGDRFIVFPEPGDNDGHGGLRGGSYIFTKTVFRVYEVGGIKYHESVQNGRAVDGRGIDSDLPLKMPVIKLHL